MTWRIEKQDVPSSLLPFVLFVVVLGCDAGDWVIADSDVVLHRRLLPFLGHGFGEWWGYYIGGKHNECKGVRQISINLCLPGSYPAMWINSWCKCKKAESDPVQDPAILIHLLRRVDQIWQSGFREQVLLMQKLIRQCNSLWQFSVLLGMAGSFACVFVRLLWSKAR